MFQQRFASCFLLLSDHHAKEKDGEKKKKEKSSEWKNHMLTPVTLHDFARENGEVKGRGDVTLVSCEEKHFPLFWDNFEIN